MEISAQQFREVQILMRDLCGLALGDDKTYLVRARLEHIVAAHGGGSFTEYLSRIQQKTALSMRDELVEALTTGETSFFRDGHPFEEFRRRILPVLAKTIRERRASGYPLPQARIWSAGCSTGQEPYSVAMAVHEFILGNRALDLRGENFPILATDVSRKSLAMARKGSFPNHMLDRGLSAEQRNRYFSQTENSGIASEELRRLIEFRQLNLIDRLNVVGQFEVIFCRNVLIYFDAGIRQQICQQFYDLLTPGGLLIVGAAESLYRLDTRFVPEQLGPTSVYRKCSTGLSSL